MATEQDRKFMLETIRLMRQTGCVEKTGGPFAALIVKGGKVIATGGNRVIADKDPTAHGEIVAIREACKKLGTHDLSGCTMYTSCMCCPMCYAASYWARMDKVFYAAACEDYVNDFDDVSIYKDLELPMHERLLKPEQICNAEAVKVWEEWRKIPDRTLY